MEHLVQVRQSCERCNLHCIAFKSHDCKIKLYKQELSWGGVRLLRLCEDCFKECSENKVELERVK